MGRRSKLPSRSVPGKRSNRKCPRKDRISQLPDDILVLILSLLTLKEATRSSVLSKRWKTLWMHIPVLHFDATQVLLLRLRNNRKMLGMERCKFVNWVNHTLELHKVQVLDEFRIYFDLDKSFQHEIDKWLEYALSRRVQSLELNLLQQGRLPSHPDDCYDLPNQVSSNGTDNNTPLPDSDHCGIRIPAYGGFKSLKSLSLQNVNVTSEFIQSLLFTCPFLERLIVVASGVLTNLAVSGPYPMLKYLELEYNPLDSITISNLDLVSLKLSKPKLLNVSNLPMLTDLSIQGVFSSLSSYVFSKFSFCLSQLETLSLDTDETELIRRPYVYPELLKLKQLIITVGAYADSLMGLTFLIKACPNLQKLVLEFWGFYFGIILIPEFEKVKRCSLKSLKAVEVSGYTGRPGEDELIMYLVENSVALEKLSINPKSRNFGSLRKKNRRQKDAGNHAKDQFEGVVPPHVELVIL